MASIKLLVLFAILMAFGSQLTTAAPPHEKECVENLIGVSILPEILGPHLQSNINLLSLHSATRITSAAPDTVT